MRKKRFLGAILLSLSFCFVSGVGYGEVKQPAEVDIEFYMELYPDDGVKGINEWIKAIGDAYPSILDFQLLKAQVKYMMRNPTNFSDVAFGYDVYGFGMKWPIEIDTKKKIIVDITDSRNRLFNKSGVALLESFKEELEVVYSFIDHITTSMEYDIIARFYSKGDIPLGYFYEGEYHLWEANTGEKIEGDKVTSSEPFLFENTEFWETRRVSSGAILGTKVTGEIVNQSGVNYVSHAWFRVTLYGSQGEVLGWREFTTFGLKDGQRKQFEAKFYDVELNRVSDYKIEFDRGS